METKSGMLIQRGDVERLLKSLLFIMMHAQVVPGVYSSGYYDGYKDALIAVGMALDCNEIESVGELTVKNE